MKVWTIVAALVFLAAPAMAQDKGITLFYLGGWDCPPCVAWKNHEKPRMVAAPEYGRITYVEIDVPNLKHVMEEQYWPAQHRPILAQLQNRGGTPRFIVAKDGKVVLDVITNNPWAQAWHKVRELVGKAA